jgi:hypothetical protein
MSLATTQIFVPCRFTGSCNNLSEERFERDAKHGGGVLECADSALGTVTFTSRHGPNVAHAPSSAGVRSCPDNSSKLLDSSAAVR